MKNGEPCSLCHQPTETEKDTPSYMRVNFIDGAGQLCDTCYEVIAENKEWHNLC